MKLEKQTVTSKVDWDKVLDLGKVRDCEIALQYGVSQTAVLLARKRRGIAPFCTRIYHNIDWGQVPLGKYPDEYLADTLGCSKVLVHKERNKRKIPPHGMLFRTSENQGAYYEEAIIDLWLHNQGIQHVFQAKIGPYRVDWLLGTCEVWEFLGMWSHRIYGEEYRSSFQRKKEYLEANGYSVRGIHKSEIAPLKAEVNLTDLHSMGSFVCRGCGRSNQKHQAHALCGTCVGRQARGVDLALPVMPLLREADYFKCSCCGSEDRKKQAKGLCLRCYNKESKKRYEGSLHVTRKTTNTPGLAKALNLSGPAIGALTATARDVALRNPALNLYPAQWASAVQEALS